jgi:hypothetical protein
MNSAFMSRNKSAEVSSAYWIFVPILLFAIVYALCMTLAYVEGDHAATLAYHLFGHNPQFQPPYAAYQGMADAILSRLPSDERLLYTVGNLITSAATVGTVLLMLALSFDWLNITSPKQRLLAAVVLLFASPEFFYLGLTYSPTMLAMCCILGAHLWLRHIISHAKASAQPLRRYLPALAVTAMLFGLGVSFRWSTGVYGVVIITDISIRLVRLAPANISKTRRLALVLGWGMAAGAAASAAIFVSAIAAGYSLTDVLGELTRGNLVFHQTGVAMNDTLTLSYRTVGSLLPLLTPVASLLAFGGFIAFIRERSSLAFVVAVGLLAAVPFIPSGVPKMMMMAVPVIVLCIVRGVLAVSAVRRPHALRYAVWGLIIGGLFLQWFVGVQVTTARTAWGPSFEMRPYDRIEMPGTHFKVAFAPGAAFSTPESPRPIFGHFYVLFGGGWRSFQNSQEQEREDALDYALEHEMPMLITVYPSALILNRLVTDSFTTQDAFSTPYALNPAITERRFSNGNGEQITVLYYEVAAEATMTDAQQVASLASTWPKAVVHGGPRFMQTLYEIAPECLTKLGPASAVLDLSQLRDHLS